jgi:hypothetical protein
MPLNPTGLETDLLALFSNPPATRSACAQEWADAMQAYASGVIPASTTVAAAAAVLKTSLEAAFALPAAGAAVDTAFQVFAATVGTGMLPGWVATPPPAPPGFPAQLASPHPATHALAATAFKNLIDVWMKTGTAVPSGGGAPVNWS